MCKRPVQGRRAGHTPPPSPTSTTAPSLPLERAPPPPSAPPPPLLALPSLLSPGAKPLSLALPLPRTAGRYTGGRSAPLAAGAEAEAPGVPPNADRREGWGRRVCR